MDSNFRFDRYPEPNFEMGMGEGYSQMVWSYRLKKTIINRIRYWLFCKFFPFKIIRWESDK
ncbi:hypothetical protein LCGC14_1153480 [marine sediment metagenome]|uniref:Uncharacterized protein n=1 Tax=marine sediment metagenome TaxID=412755 RepID=A0A0F9PD06_9ZZZZ